MCGPGRVMINEIHQKEKDKYQRSSLMWDIKEQSKEQKKAKAKKFSKVNGRRLKWYRDQYDGVDGHWSQ